MAKKNSNNAEELLEDANAPRGPKKKGPVALKDFRITQNEVDIVIHAGDDLSAVPTLYLENLKTEGVIE